MRAQKQIIYMSHKALDQLKKMSNGDKLLQQFYYDVCEVNFKYLLRLTLELPTHAGESIDLR